MLAHCLLPLTVCRCQILQRIVLAAFMTSTDYLFFPTLNLSSLSLTALRDEKWKMEIMVIKKRIYADQMQNKKRLNF